MGNSVTQQAAAVTAAAAAVAAAVAVSVIENHINSAYQATDTHITAC
jgi:hypothetical protein